MTYDTAINPADTSDYRDRLKRWAIAHLIPEQNPIIVGRFRSRSDADGHLKFLHHQFPGDQFVVIFDRR